MPRKPKNLPEPLYKINRIEFLDKFLGVQFTAFNRFIAEFQNAPLVRFYYLDGGSHVNNYIICFMKHFAFTIYIYKHENLTNDYRLPSRPLYTKFHVDDIEFFTFWRYESPAAIPPRSFESKDFSNEIFDENAGASFARMAEYINSVYLNRKTEKWMGLSAISATWGFTPECKVDTEVRSYITYNDLIVGPDSDTLGGGNTHNVHDLFHFWILMNQRFEGVNIFEEVQNLILPMQENIQPNLGINEIEVDPGQIFDPETTIFQINDRRSERWLLYDDMGNIIGNKDFAQLPISVTSSDKIQLYMFYDVSFCRIKGILYVVSVDLKFTGTEISGKLVTLQMTFENWIKYKQYIPIENVATPEWFPGQFPKTEFCHMVFYGGHSFYVSDGYVIEANITRLTKEAGYLTIKFITDTFGAWLRFVPMQYVVAYGKWNEYMTPDPILLAEILKKQNWSIWVHTKGITIIDNKQALIELGRRGTKYAASIPGLTSLTSLITTGGSI